MEPKLIYPESGELDCWQNCYGHPLTLGLCVNITDPELHLTDESENDVFAISAMKFDDLGLRLSLISVKGEEVVSNFTDWAYRYARIDQIKPVLVTE